MKTTNRHSTIALAILALLYEEPMHVYRMQQLIKERGKDEVINVRQRAGLYQTIDRLLRAKFITVQETVRKENRPERTVYKLSEKGRETVVTWLRRMLSKPAREFPAFPAALAYLPLLTPEDARTQLEYRAQALAAEVDRIDTQLRGAEAAVPRLFLVESEYLRAVLQTELTWVRSIIDDLYAGRLTWSEEWLREIAAKPGKGDRQQGFSQEG